MFRSLFFFIDVSHSSPTHSYCRYSSTMSTSIRCIETRVSAVLDSVLDSVLPQQTCVTVSFCLASRLTLQTFALEIAAGSATKSRFVPRNFLLFVLSLSGQIAVFNRK